MNVFVIVVTYNGNKWIEKCFGSILESSVPLKVIAIDNASTDNTVSLIKNLFPQVEVIETMTNLGFGRANNIGLRKAISENVDFVFLLNQDAWVEKDTIENLVTSLQTDSTLGVISPFHMNYEGTDVEIYFKKFVYPVGKLMSGQGYYEVPFIHAACWLMPLKTIELVGGFDPLFFHYAEDNDYVQRVHYNGLKVGFVENAYVYHFGTNENINNITKLKRHNILIMAKNPIGSHLGVFLLLIKGWFKTFKNESSHNAYFYALTKWRRIYRSRKEQLKPMAFIDTL